VLDGFDTLFELAQAELIPFIEQARALGMHEPTYPPKDATC
jgi:hypothetical protein